MAKKKLTARWVTDIDAFDTKYIDGRKHRLQNYSGRFGVALSDCRTVVPEDGFVYDMASVPRIAWPIFPPDGDGPRGRYGPAACIHDWLYVNQHVGGIPIKRKYADDVFRAVLELSEVSPLRVWVMYQAVRVGGWKGWSYERNRRRKAGKL